MGTIICKKQNTQEITFTKEGYYMTPVFNDCECMLFPSKDQRDWSKFQRPFKDGDIISDSLGTCIFKGEGMIQGTVDYYCGISCDRFSIQQNGHYGYIADYRFATEEEKAKLFDAIKANGYEWNEGTKTLAKLIKPKFKVGDRIKYRSGEIVYRVVQITEDTYVLDNLCSIPILMEHMYNLVPDKFDINSLIPFESKVLVRDTNSQDWTGSFYSHYNIKDQYPFYCINYGRFKQCIPYEGNEHLLGKTDCCNDFYKNW
jgi:hypothetical protein